MDSFLAHLPKLPDNLEMAEWDKAAIDFGIPEIMLMENAGRAIFEVIQELYGPVNGKQVCLFMGGGNNGGDAACVARHLIDAGSKAAIYCTRERADIRGAAEWHLNLAIKNGATFYHLPKSGSPTKGSFLSTYIDYEDSNGLPCFFIDGLLGTGFKGYLKCALEKTIESINSLARILEIPIISIDIPSGLNSMTGRPAPVAIKADTTVTLAAAKPGLLMPGAPAYTGRLVCRSIQIPVALKSRCPSKYRLLAGESLLYSPEKKSNSFKNTYGHVLIIGGARGFAGAAHLACAAALRAGAGLVSVCAPSENLQLIKADWPEIMTLSAGQQKEWPAKIPVELQERIKCANAIVIGPGMGRGEDAAAFLNAFLNLDNRPSAVIDADALFLLSKQPQLACRLSARDIITPHPGEAGYLIGCNGPEVQNNRQGALERLCAFSKAVAVLKGACTLIGQKDNLRLLSPYDIPQLAIGGSGDTLAGCIAAFMSSEIYRGLEPISHAALGVATHSMADLSLVKTYPDRGLVASELANALPFAREFVIKQKKPLAGLMPWPQ